jgi:c-di-GMP-binding flagellar brake protein YcgR
MAMETAPMQLDELAASSGGLDEFRLASRHDVLGLLKRLLDAASLLHLNTAEGAVYTTTLWTIDAAAGALGLSADSHHPALQRVLESDDVTVVGYLDNIKVQFDLQDLVLVHGTRSCALRAPLPRCVYRFQRRNSFRVRPLARGAPTVTLPHPMIPEMQLTLRVLDVSVGGCALLLPDDVPPIEPGVRVNGVDIALDADTRLRAALVIHHVSAVGADPGARRLGCEFAGLSGEGTRSLQLFVDQVEKRRRMFSL